MAARAKREAKIPRLLTSVEYSAESKLVRLQYQEGPEGTLLLATRELPLGKLTAAAKKHLNDFFREMARHIDAKPVGG